MDARRSAMQKRISRKQEKKAAEDLGGRTQAASGAARFGGGDVRAPGYRIECKYTEKPYYILKLSELEKLQKQAYGSLEQPVMQLAFVDRLGRRKEFAISKHSQEVVVCYKSTAKSIKVHLSEIEATLTLNLPFVVLFISRGHKAVTWSFRSWSDFVKEANQCS
jgi:hypothetical protein